MYENTPHSFVKHGQVLVMNKTALASRISGCITAAENTQQKMALLHDTSADVTEGWVPRHDECWWHAWEFYSLIFTSSITSDAREQHNIEIIIIIVWKQA